MSAILVTGASGFLGQRTLPKLIAAGHSVSRHALTEGEGCELAGDLSDASDAERVLGHAKWDVIVNLGGPVTGGSEDLGTGMTVIAAHTRIALHLRRYASHARIVHASSMTVYGTPTSLPVTENHVRRPRHLYGLAKMLAEDVLLTAPQLDTWVLRFAGLFSELRTTGALFHFSRAARRGETLRVSTPDPTPWDVLHVDDAADAIVLAVSARTTGGGAVNVSYGAPVELTAIARWLAAHAGQGSLVESTIVHPVLQLDITRARELLGWSPPLLHDRLAQLFASYV